MAAMAHAIASRPSLYYTGLMTAASVNADNRYCSQHRQPRRECRPGDRHAQPLRCSDELMAQVEAKAQALGLDRNAGIEMALAEWVASPLAARMIRQVLRGAGKPVPVVFREPARP